MFHKILNIYIFQIYFSTGSIGNTALGDPVPCIKEINPSDFVEMITIRLRSVLKVSKKIIKKINNIIIFIG